MNAKINEINIGLMVLSLAVAVFLPFKLFLLAYAVLGPLHYLTEISWLHDRNYYLPKKSNIIPFYILGAAYILAALVYGDTEYGQLTMFLTVVISFYMALCFTVEPQTRKYCYLLIPGIIYAFTYEFTITFVTILLVTIVHVYLFTGLFILYGSMKTKSKMGYLSVLVFMLMPILCFVLPSYAIESTPWVMSTYMDVAGKLTHALNQLFSTDIKNDNTMSAFENIARFISFAFTYHYLNWFSKTKIIGWNQISNLRRTAILLSWGAAVGIYYYDYMLGFKAVLTISFLHVLLEFPLNWVSIKGIYQSVTHKV